MAVAGAERRDAPAIVSVRRTARVPDEAKLCVAPLSSCDDLLDGIAALAHVACEPIDERSQDWVRRRLDRDGASLSRSRVTPYDAAGSPGTCTFSTLWSCVSRRSWRPIEMPFLPTVIASTRRNVRSPIPCVWTPVRAFKFLNPIRELCLHCRLLLPLLLLPRLLLLFEVGLLVRAERKRRQLVRCHRSQRTRLYRRRHAACRVHGYGAASCVATRSTTVCFLTVCVYSHT